MSWCFSGSQTLHQIIIEEIDAAPAADYLVMNSGQLGQVVEEEGKKEG
jgi:hypothetical protein